MAGVSVIGRLTSLTVDGVLVSGMNRYAENQNAPATTVGAFEETTPESFPGDDTTTFTFSGKLRKGDPGQDAIRAARAAGTTVTLEVLPDGASGFSIPVLIGTMTHTADSLSGPQTVSFECVPQGPKTPVGADFPNL